MRLAGQCGGTRSGRPTDGERRDVARLTDLQLSRLPGRSRLAEAIRYALGRLSALTRFLDDKRIDLDNNPRGAGDTTDQPGPQDQPVRRQRECANRWAIVASLVETAKLNGVEPFTWLHDSLTMMVNGHEVSRLDDLLPWSGRAGHS